MHSMHPKEAVELDPGPADTKAVQAASMQAVWNCRASHASIHVNSEIRAIVQPLVMDNPESICLCRLRSKGF